MSYNGVGLTSVRGSGTSGYVQRNLSHVSVKRKTLEQIQREQQAAMKPPVPKKANAEILEHNQKRRIEVQIVMYEDSLKERGLKPDEIKSKSDEMRQKLTLKLNRGESIDGARLSGSHAMSAAKDRENARLASAFGLAPNRAEGEAFARMGKEV